MLNFIENKKNKENLIIFIHGFTGGEDTWLDSNKTPKKFIKFIFNNKEIKKSYNSAYLLYDTKFISTPDNLIGKVLRTTTNTGKNLNVKDISDAFCSIIDVSLRKYKRIALIAHSMGGLIAKSTILNLIENKNNEKIKLFCSIAVPHNGSELASFAELFVKNNQFIDLKPIGEFSTDMNQKWVLSKKLPHTVYYCGKNDEIVKEHSALAYEARKVDVVYSFDNHSSIINPVDSNNIILDSIIEELINILLPEEKKKNLNVKISLTDNFSNYHFTINENLNDFDIDKRLSILKVLAEKLNLDLDSISMNSIKKGSVKFTLSIPREKEKDLIELLQKGSLSSLNIISVKNDADKVLFSAKKEKTQLSNEKKEYENFGLSGNVLIPATRRIQSKIRKYINFELNDVLKVSTKNPQSILINNYVGKVTNRQNIGKNNESFTIRVRKYNRRRYSRVLQRNYLNNQDSYYDMVFFLNSNKILDIKNFGKHNSGTIESSVAISNIKSFNNKKPKRQSFNFQTHKSSPKFSSNTIIVKTSISGTAAVFGNKSTNNKSTHDKSNRKNST